MKRHFYYKIGLFLSFGVKWIDMSWNFDYYPSVAFNDGHLRKGKDMSKEKVINGIAKSVASVLKTSLRVEANTTSCILVYQPKAPKELSRFKKN